MRTRIKMCGFTDESDIDVAIALGVDAIGLVFYPPSKRFVDAEQACRLAQRAPLFVTKVGLFVDQPIVEVTNILRHVALDLLQFHGSETPEYCESFELPYIKVIGVPAVTNDAEKSLVKDQIHQTVELHRNALGYLLDTKATNSPGGTGLAFDWSVVPDGLVKPVVLAGGLNKGNVTEAIHQVKPYAVDVSSGIEQSPGRKSRLLMSEFVHQVNISH